MNNGYQPKSDGTPMGSPPNQGSSAKKDDPFLKMLDITLQHVSKHANNSDRLAYALYRTMEGDDVDAFDLLHELGYTDENGEWISDEDEE